MVKLSTLVLIGLLFTGCSTAIQPTNIDNIPNKSINNSLSSNSLSKEDIARLNKEYLSFNTKALSTEYFQKKLVKLIASDNGVANGSKIVTELQYAKYKGEAIIPFKAMTNANPSFYNTLKSIASVVNQRTVDSPFDIFINSGKLPPNAPTVLTPTSITSMAFTANWDVSADSTSGYVITLKKGSTNVNTINVSGQNTTSYRVTGLDPSTAYNYTVQTNNDSLLSSDSNSVSFSAPSSITSTIAGSILGDLDDNGTSAQFRNPNGIAIDPSGNIYVVDIFNHKIRKIANDANRTVSTIAGSTSGYKDDNGTSAQFFSPNGITIDSSGNLYITDSGNSKIRKIANDANHTVSTFASQFSYPQGIVIDSQGNLYVADTNNNKIKKIANDVNHTVSTIAGTNSGYIDGDGTSAKFRNPSSITIDSSDNLYVTESGNHRIRKIANNANYTVSTIAGSSSGYSNGNGTSALFNSPNGITIDSSGNLYVTDSLNNKIRKIANDANHTVSTITGNADGYQDGNGTSAQFSYPQGITADSSGNLYVTDSGNHKIRKIQ